MIARMLKNLDTPRIVDALRIFGPARAKTISGKRIEMEDGSPITVEHIMKVYALPREKAEQFVRRHG